MLWESYPDAMSKALQIHNNIFRSLLIKYKGYEVKTEGDSFMLVSAKTNIQLSVYLSISLSIYNQHIIYNI